MSVLSKIILLLAALAAGSYLFAPEMSAYPLQALIKAMPIWLLAVLAWREAPKQYRLPLTLALGFSGLGDFALSAPYSLSFPAGMAAFLVGHLFYLWIFTRTFRPWSQLDGSRRLMIGLIVVDAFIMGAILLPRTGALMPAITVYFTVLSLMAAASFAGRVPRWVRLGAILFVLSDTLIGIDRFLMPLEFRHLAVLGTYYAAQMLLFAGLVWQSRK